MNFLETLRAHKGGLILLKTELFWWGGRGYDGIPERVCLLMDSAPAGAPARLLQHPVARGRAAGLPFDVALLLIDGCPHWVWVSSDDLELLQPGCNPATAVVYCS